MIIATILPSKGSWFITAGGCISEQYEQHIGQHIYLFYGMVLGRYIILILTNQLVGVVSLRPSGMSSKVVGHSAAFGDSSQFSEESVGLERSLGIN